MTLPALSRAALPALVAAVGERASMRFVESFAADIRNPHTRRAYYRAGEEFPHLARLYDRERDEVSLYEVDRFEIRWF